MDNQSQSQTPERPGSRSAACYPFTFADVEHLTHAAAQESAGDEFFVCVQIVPPRYQGPVTLVKVTKAGHCVVLSDYPLEEPPEYHPTTYINHRQGRQYRSTVKTYRLARKRCG